MVEKLLILTFISVSGCHSVTTTVYFGSWNNMVPYCAVFISARIVAQNFYACHAVDYFVCLFIFGTNQLNLLLFIIVGIAS